MSAFVALLRSAAVVMLCGGPAALAQFIPGRLYTPTDGGVIIEWDQQLQLRRQFTVPGVETATGAVFNDAGNLVFIGRRAGSTRVMEINSSGTILREYNTGLGSLFRGSYIDFDPASRRYVIADYRRVTVLSANLALVASTPSTFERASGVAFAPGNVILATDQSGGTLRRFNASTLAEMTPITIGGWVRTGIDVTGSGHVLLTAFGDGTVQRLTNGQPPLVTLVGGLGYGNLSDVRDLGNGTFVTSDGRGLLKIYSSSGSLLRTGVSTTFSDGVAFLVPSPAGLVVLASGLVAIRRRRAG
ncbi:MAG: hypothetical protein FJ255_08585 [Phycisphaerae bacterium]|nr:hypothetical protein [Phycisphaerae bacterium]